MAVIGAVVFDRVRVWPTGGGDVLSREDSRRLAQLERQLQRSDPEFCARMTAGHADLPPRRPPISLILTAVVTWVVAVILAVVGWWLAAGTAVLCATFVLATVVRRLTPRRPEPAGLDRDHPGPGHPEPDHPEPGRPESGRRTDDPGAPSA